MRRAAAYHLYAKACLTYATYTDDLCRNWNAEPISQAEAQELLRKGKAAANEVNKNYNGVRIVLGEKKATVKAEVYCKTGEDFTEIFPRLYGQFDKIAREFKKVYNKELEIAQTLEEKEAEEAYKNRPASELVGQVKEVKFRLCDKDKNPTTVFGDPLKSAGTGYIQASFTLAPRKAADKSYNFELRIVSEATVTDPTGVYGDTKPARKMKIVNTIELKKSKKEATFHFL